MPLLKFRVLSGGATPAARGLFCLPRYFSFFLTLYFEITFQEVSKIVPRSLVYPLTDLLMWLHLFFGKMYIT